MQEAAYIVMEFFFLSYNTLYHALLETQVCFKWAMIINVAQKLCLLKLQNRHRHIVFNIYLYTLSYGVTYEKES